MECYVLNGCAQWVCLMGKYFGCYWGNYCVLNRTLLVCSTGNYWCAQWEIIMCSTGNYWSAQWEFRCSTGSYVLNGKLLCAQLDIIEVLNGISMGIMMCSTGHYWGVQREVMCSTGNYNVLNGNL